MTSANKRVFRNALFAMAAVAALWWFLADRPSRLGGSELPARVLRDYIDAARRRDCAAVVAALSVRSRELVVAAVAGRSTLERSFCDYSPAPAKLPDFETNRIRVERVLGGPPWSPPATPTTASSDSSAGVVAVTPTLSRSKTEPGALT